MQKDLLDEGGGGHTWKKQQLFFFYFLYVIAEIVFLTHNYQSVLAECEKHFRGLFEG